MKLAALAVLGVVVVACGNSPTASANPDAAHLSTTVRELREGQVVDSVPCLGADLPEHHIHVHLAVYDDGVLVTVPAGIGVGRPWGFDATGFLATGSCFAWMHTHDTTGVIHIVTPQQRLFTLGQLFEIWGQPLTAAGVFNYQGAPTVLVDGRRYSGDPRVLGMSAFENIVLELGKRPAAAPASIYDFGSLSR